MFELLQKIDGFISSAKTNAADTLDKVADVMHSWETYLRNVAAGLKQAGDPADVEARESELRALVAPKAAAVGANGEWLKIAVQVFLKVLELLKQKQ